MRTRLWVRRSLYFLPLVVAAPLAGWLLLPSRSAAYANGPASGINARSAATTPALSPSETDPDAPKGVGGLSGKTLYDQYCAACHGADGLGTRRSNDVGLRGKGAADIDFQLSTGRMPMRDTTMRLPPYRATLPPADIKALEYYIDTYISKGGPPVPAVNVASGDPAHGGELFREDCAACHSWAGEGGVLSNSYVPRITDATATQVAEAIRVGPDQMPVFGPGEISQQQLNDIVAYVTQNLQHQYDKGGDPMNHLGPVAEGLVALAIVLPLIIFFMLWVGQRG